MISNKKNTLFFTVIVLFLGFSFFQNFAKREKHERRKQRKSNKIQKTWPKEYRDNNFEKLTITGPAKLEKVKVGETATITGSATIVNSTINHLIVTGLMDACNSFFNSAVITGSVSIKNCKTKDNFSVTGAFKTVDSTFDNVKDTGPFSCTNSTTSNKLEVTGTLEAYNSTLLDIEVTTNDTITFENSSANKMIVRENKSVGWLSKPQVIEVHLKGKSCIKMIEFEPNIKGTVILEGEAASVGSVKNGTIKILK